MRKYECQIFKLASKFQDRLKQLQQEDRSWYESIFNEPENPGEFDQLDEVALRNYVDRLPNYKRRYNVPTVIPQNKNITVAPIVRKPQTPIAEPQTSIIEKSPQAPIVDSLQKPIINVPETFSGKQDSVVTKRQVDKLQYQEMMNNFAKTLSQQISSVSNLPRPIEKHLKFLADHVREAGKKYRLDTYAITSGLKDYQYMSKQIPVILDIIRFLS